MVDELIGLRAFARMVGVSLSAIQKAIDVGRLVAVKTPAGRKLPAAQVEMWNLGHQRPIEAEANFEELLDEEEPSSWHLEKTKQEALLAGERRKKIQLEREELEGKLHREEDVEAVWTDILSRTRTRILAIPSKAAPLLARMHKPTPATIQDALDVLVREALSELAEYDKAKIRAKRRRRVAKSGR